MVNLEELRDQLRRTSCRPGLHVSILDRFGQQGFNCCRHVLRSRRIKVHAHAGAVLLESVADVEVLLAVVPQREIDKRTASCSQLHGRAQAALRQGHIADRQARGPATAIMRKSGTRFLIVGKAFIRRPKSSAPTPEPPTDAMQTTSPSR